MSNEDIQAIFKGRAAALQQQLAQRDTDRSSIQQERIATMEKLGVSTAFEELAQFLNGKDSESMDVRRLLGSRLIHNYDADLINMGKSVYGVAQIKKGVLALGQAFEVDEGPKGVKWEERRYQPYISIGLTATIDLDRDPRGQVLLLASRHPDIPEFYGYVYSRYTCTTTEEVAAAAMDFLTIDLNQTPLAIEKDEQVTDKRTDTLVESPVLYVMVSPEGTSEEKYRAKYSPRTPFNYRNPTNIDREISQDRWQLWKVVNRTKGPSGKTHLRDLYKRHEVFALVDCLDDTLPSGPAHRGQKS